MGLSIGLALPEADSELDNPPQEATGRPEHEAVAPFPWYLLGATAVFLWQTEQGDKRYAALFLLLLLAPLGRHPKVNTGRRRSPSSLFHPVTAVDYVSASGASYPWKPQAAEERGHGKFPADPKRHPLQRPPPRPLTSQKFLGPAAPRSHA